MKRISLEELMKRRDKRTSAFQMKEINISHIKEALTKYLEDLPIFRHNEIIDIDIPALTTETVAVKIYTKDNRGTELLKRDKL